jgi:hypothetical protein
MNKVILKRLKLGATSLSPRDANFSSTKWSAAPMTQQEWTILAIATVLMVPNLTGAAFAIRGLLKSSPRSSNTPRRETPVRRIG